ncbi:Peptidoglycan-binding protein ArfA [Falsiruegeria litorea R37]|uniref:Peptidoglycan-binding protein ArfA n=1 Tax=Falsiruegeria litorea R37 TaxID=1200284 RepID=A0A1Y5TPI3_9RHOB|nr:OmpA family protein [Falsiruegeria litorea]SLN65253.1 Peptidoglycan-binding protein ArfA [Falsiruegeria litorea R37]
MRLPLSIVVALTFALAAGLCLVAASFAVTTVEENSEIVVRRALDRNGHDWAEVQANGLQVIMTGTAKDEATRFNALTVVGDEVDPSRVIDEMRIAPSADLAPPRFSAEILRNDSGISIIGLIPAQSDRDEIIEELISLAGEDNVTDLLETADYSVPGGWIDAMGFSLKALSMLPRSKVSVAAGQVSITAISDSAEAKKQLEDALNRAAPPGLRIGIDIAAPRPVITPFTMRFLIDETGPRFDACSAQDRIAQARILSAARQAGMEGSPSCTIGMGVPSPQWARASELSISALAELGQGTVTIADADITLVAAQGTDQGRFDRVVGELEAELPDVFALHAVLPAPEISDTAGPPEFTATLSPEGLVQLRGRLNDDNLRHMVDSYAKAAFGTDAVYTAARVVPDLPASWPVRVLAGLEALSMLANGALTVTPDNVTLSGVSEQEDASAQIAGLLSDKLGQAQTYDLSVTYRAPPEPNDKAPDPEVCEAEIALVQETGKIAFEPGSTTIAAASLDTMNKIADILDACGQIRLEIQGHTDSQGREEMNQQLSQARAQSVLNELRSRRILTSSYVAVGYGESQPIADNKTEDGREANRRIEFRLIRPEASNEEASTLDAIAEEAPSEATETGATAEEDASQTDAEDQ